MKFRMVGCSHHQSAVAVREQLAFSDDLAAQTLEAWRQWRPDSEAVLLSTCNRVEFYVAAPPDEIPPCPMLMKRMLAEAHALSVDQIQDQLFTLKDEDAVTHLFRVAASLDSMVLGEPQILSQVKSAYELASKLGVAGPLTHGCFQSALRVARRVASETKLHRHRVSIPSVAISDFAGEIFEQFDDKRVLVIGAGEMADETLRYLVDAGAKKITIVNRDPLKAEQLALEWKGESASMIDLNNQLIRADLVISTTSADEPIVTLETFHKKVAPGRKQRPLFILDLALPRDFDPAIGDELGVYLYSIDDLSAACDRNRRAREQALPAAEKIIDEERQAFFVAASGRVSGPVIARLRQGLERPKTAELERLFNKLPDLDDRARQEIQQFADRLVNKMLHPPMESLREEAKNGAPRGLLDALSRLFQLKE